MYVVWGPEGSCPRASPEIVFFCTSILTAAKGTACNVLHGFSPLQKLHKLRDGGTG